MKVLIAYDGSEFSDAAIIDLRRAGLRSAAEALVLSVAEIAPQLANASYATIAGLTSYPPDEEEIEILSGRELTKAESLTAVAADRLRADFPAWHVSTEAWIDAAAAAIIRKVHSWRPDLAVVGSHGLSGADRLALGSVAKHVLQHADCSVRISRHRLHSQERAIRLVIGVAGSNDAKTVVQAVAERNWPAGTEVRVVGVLEAPIPLATTPQLGGMTAAVEEGETRARLETVIQDAVQALAKTGLHATPHLLAGKAAKVLLEEAEKWGADSVFVGERHLHRLERIFLGSVSTAVASRAHCSVEIVRSKP